jgi:sugar lactone lactonase YvrE
MNIRSIGDDLSAARMSRQVRRIAAVAASVVVSAVAWAQTNVVSTLAGLAGTPGYINATGGSARFSFTTPSGIAVDAAGNAYVADAVNNAIRKIDTNGVVTTFAGSTTGVSGNVDSVTGTDARFTQPRAIAIDGVGNLYVADTGNHAIRMITPAGAVSTIAGPGGTGTTGASGYQNLSGTAARFNTPFGIAADRAGSGGAAVNLFVADAGNNAIRQVVVAGGATTTLAGSTTGASGSDNGTLANARFSLPSGVAANAAGTLLYVADTNNNLIRRIDVSGNAVTTLAGSGSAAYAEGSGTAASFNFPRGIALDASGNVLVADTLNHVIRLITSAGVTSRYAGLAPAGNAGSTDGLALTEAKFSVPSGIAVGSTGAYVVDTNNYTVRLIAESVPGTAPSITAHPASVSAAAGGSAFFSVTATGTAPLSYQWQFSTNAGASWNSVSALTGAVVSGGTSSFLTLSNLTIALNNAQFRALVSNSAGNATSNVATLTVNQAPVITNAFTDFFVALGHSISATITASGSPTPTFNTPTGNFPPWATLNPTTGVISGAPTDQAHVTASPYLFSVSATNSAGTSSAVAFSITVQTGPAITTQPVSQTVQTGQSVVFSVAATSATSITYQWQFRQSSTGGWSPLADGAFVAGGTISGSTGSTLLISGVPLAMSGYQFRANLTNADGLSTSHAATLTVGQAPAFTSATSTTFIANQANVFTFTASGSPAPSFTASGGSLPAGAVLNPATGILTATPTSADVAASPYVFIVTATNTAGSAVQVFTLHVSATPLAPQITTQPLSQSVGLGQNATFTVVATGNPEPTYQWRRLRAGESEFVNISDGDDYEGTNTATLTVKSVSTLMNGDMFSVVLSNINGTVTSSSAELTITIGTVFSTFVGQPGAQGSTDGIGTAARLRAPTSIAIDSVGNLYVADAANHVIRKITTSGVVTTLAGMAGVGGNADGFGSAARFNTPSAVAVDAAGNVYVADTSNHLVRLVTPAGAVTTLAGMAGVLGSADGVGADARFALPSGIAVDTAGSIYVADLLNHTIRRITGNIVMTLAGTAGAIGTIDGVGAAARFSFPMGLAVDSGFNVYVADSRNHTIRKIAPGGSVSTLAGLAGVVGSADGTGSNARFNQPQGVALGASGNLYVADTNNHVIRRITSAGEVTTVAGVAGASGSTDGAATTVRFNQPNDVAVDSSGNIYVADTFNHTIRRSGSLAAPTITTPPANQSVIAGASATFTVVATGSPTPVLQWQRRAAGTETFVNLTNDATYSGVNTPTLTVSGTTTAMSGDEFRVIANNLVSPNATSDAVTLTVLPPTVPPSITTQPATTTVNLGDTATFTVTAAGTAPLSYQWRKDGVPLAGATSATLVVPNVQLSSAGVYTVVVTSPFGTLTSMPAGLVVNTPPIIAVQPRTQTALLGTFATFSVGLSSGSGVTYQWRRNGAAIPGANSASLTVSSITAADAGNYDVIVTNALGSVTSSLAQLNVVTSPTAPVITAQPAARTVVAGGTVTLSVAATGAPGPNVQWRKNGSNIPGATNTSLVITNAQAGDSGVYDVVVSNTQGSVTSVMIVLRVIPRSYAGVYFGSFGAGLGNFALHIREDNTGMFLGYLPASTAPVMNLRLSVDDNGNFSFSQAATGALSAVSVSGAISNTGAISGAISGGVNTSLSATRSADVGTSQSIAGFYQGGVSNSGGVAYLVTSATGQAFAVVQVGSATDGGAGTVNSSGNVSIATGRSTISATILPASGVVVINSSGAVTGVFAGANEGVLAAQRLANISTRARVGTGDAVAIAGFVISGQEAKPVLIRAVGPTLGLAPFSVPGVLSNPKLDLHRIVGGAAPALVATNSGISGNRASVDAAAIYAGAFALGAAGTDAAIVTTLAPGDYTATVSSATTNTGVVLVEVYDLSAAAPGQKLMNISTRATAGSAENTLIAGVVVSGVAPKRVLIRAVGPGLSPFGVTGVLAQPTVALYNSASQVIAQNTGWSGSADAAAIATVSAQVGAFPLANGDSALIVTLSPGNYTAQVTGPGTATGVALIEVYELP